MKTFGNTKAGQNRGSFDDGPKYWKDAQNLSRAVFDRPHNLQIVSGLMPARGFNMETKNGNTLFVPSLAFNPDTEEFDGVDPLLDYYGVAAAKSDYAMNVLVTDWLNQKTGGQAATTDKWNPNAGYVAVLRMTDAIVNQIAGVQTAWSTDPDNPIDLTDPDNCPCLIQMTRARKGGKSDGILEYKAQGVPKPHGYDKSYVDQLVQSGSAILWDLRRYQASRMWFASELLRSLCVHGYFETVDEMTKYVSAYVADPYRYRLVMTEAELEPAIAAHAASLGFVEGGDGWDELKASWASWEKIEGICKKNIESYFRSNGGADGGEGEGAQNLGGGHTPPPPPPPGGASNAPAPRGPAAPPAAPAPTAPPPAGPASAPPPAAVPPAGAAATPPAAVPPAASAPAAPPAAPRPAAPPPAGGLAPRPMAPPPAAPVAPPPTPAA